jgi:hypothetical protein
VLLELFQIVVSFIGTVYSSITIAQAKRDRVYVRRKQLNGFAELLTEREYYVSIGLFASQSIMLVTGVILLLFRMGFVPEQLNNLLSVYAHDASLPQLTILAKLALATSALSRSAIAFVLMATSIYRSRVREQLYSMRDPNA